MNIKIKSEKAVHSLENGTNWYENLWRDLIDPDYALNAVSMAEMELEENILTIVKSIVNESDYNKIVEQIEKLPSFTYDID